MNEQSHRQVGIWLVELGGRPIGEWLSEVDLEAAAEPGQYPTGRVWSDPDPRHALAFADVGEAMAFYRRTSRTVPVRPDGRPNRPLLAFSVEFRALPDR